MKTSNNRKRFPRRLPPCIPNDCAIGGIEWSDDPSVVKAARDLQHRWHRWLKMQAIINEDWKRDAERRLAEVAGEVETGLLLAKLEAERIADQTADATTTEKYLKELLAIRDKAWRSQAEQRLAAATRTINADIRKRDSQLRERLRRRR